MFPIQAVTRIAEIKYIYAGIRSRGNCNCLVIETWLSINVKPDLVINAGIAGSFKDDIKIGDVVMPVTDCFADAGIEDGENFLTLSEAGLADPDEFPFSNGILPADSEYTSLMSGSFKTCKSYNS